MLKQEIKWYFKREALKRPSFLLILFPYLGFNWKELLQSPFYSTTSLGILLAALIVIELVFKTLINIFKQQEKIISILFTTTVFLFFYGSYMVEVTFAFLSKRLDIVLRGRVLFASFFLIITIMQWLLVKKRVSYKIANIFFLVFGITTFVSGHNPNKEHLKDINTTIVHYKNIRVQEANNNKTANSKPVILLIADEYNSPDSLYKIIKDSSLYGFSDSLKNNNWIVHNSSYSYETSTIHSLGSLFNFNLSQDVEYSKQSLEQVASHKLLKASLYDSLEAKKVQVVNIGIFDLGKTKPFTQLYIYPKNFTQQFLLFTAYTQAKHKTNSFSTKDFDNNYYPVEAHNKFIIHQLADSLSHIKNNRLFVYAHLFMPHAPLQFEPEYKNREIKGIADYINYLKFTNKKLSELLSRLVKENKYRIILTGDHGYRGDGRINKHQTFTAYYGFDSTAIQQVQSVQDLGSLINGAF